METVKGRATAPAAGTVLNALATGTGSAFAIDLQTTATVELTEGQSVSGTIEGARTADTSLIERCVERVVERFGDGQGGVVVTESEVPMAAGLKSSSAAANATVLATLAALGVDCPRETAARIGVEAARDAGVTVTGAFDDASASMLGGVTITDNTSDELLEHGSLDWDVLVWTPDDRAYSAEADVERCAAIAPMAELVESLALDGRYGQAMTVNGLAYCGALEFPTEPLVQAMAVCDGVTLSGTGPSYIAVGDRVDLETVRSRWAQYDGQLWMTQTRTTGAQIK